MLQDRLFVSERRACRITGQHRSTQRHRPLRGDRDDALRARLRSLSREHPRWGYRHAWASRPFPLVGQSVGAFGPECKGQAG